MHAADGRKQARTNAFPAVRAQGAEGRRIKRTFPTHRLEQGVAQQPFQFGAAEGAAMAEGGAVQLRPQAGAIGGDQQNAAFGGQHPPQLAQQRPQHLGALQAMHDQDAVEEDIGKGQRVLGADQPHVARAGFGRHAELGRQGGDGAFGVHPAHVGRAIAIGQDAQALDAGPDVANAPRQDMARPLAQGLFVEGGQIVGILQHGVEISAEARPFLG